MTKEERRSNVVKKAMIYLAEKRKEYLLACFGDDLILMSTLDNETFTIDDWKKFTEIKGGHTCSTKNYIGIKQL